MVFKTATECLEKGIFYSEERIEVVKRAFYRLRGSLNFRIEFSLMESAIFFTGIYNALKNVRVIME